MTLAAEIILSVVALALAAFLIPLLVQLRRTAAKMEALADSAQRDLHQIATDIHEVQGRLDEVSALLKQSLELPASISLALGNLVKAASTTFGQGRDTPGWFDALVTGIRFALSFWQRPKKTGEEAHG